ncbi:MAG: YceI family protein [Bacteroidota bacterium]
MKTLNQFVFLFLVLGLMTACQNTPSEAVKTEEAVGKAAAASAEAAAFTVNPTTSVIKWVGSKPTGDQHMGTLNISAGKLSVENGDLKSGSFELDMNSIACTDLESGDGKEKLEGHLKNEDFFEVEKFPSGKFVITGIQKTDNKVGVTHTISGDLTLKDITKSISFDTNVALIGNDLTAVTPSFKINRTEWGINFNSGILGTVKDRLINDDIALTIDLKASNNAN